MDFDFNLDLSEVKSSSFEPIPAGEYSTVCTEAVIKTTKAGTGQYIACTFNIVGGVHQGKKLFTQFNFRNPNPKAAEIGMSQLKGYMQAAKMKETKLNNPDLLVGHNVNCVVKIKSDEAYGDKAVISYFKPFKNDTPTKPQGSDGLW